MADLVGALNAPYRLPASMVLLIAIVPLYIFIPELLDGRTLHRPELALDRLIPLRPGWAVVYGSLYLFLILLPVVLLRGEAALRAAAHAYLAAWLTAYCVFLAYPTVAARPAAIGGSGFLVAGLRFLYSADTRFNCFPSLHVAHSFLSASICRRVHAGVGRASLVAAALVALSTLFTKQHYLLDVGAGVLLALVAAAIFLPRTFASHGGRPEHDAAPLLAGTVALAIAVLVALCWLGYRVLGGA